MMAYAKYQLNLSFVGELLLGEPALMNNFHLFDYC
jgi:hypothetical protein